MHIFYCFDSREDKVNLHSLESNNDNTKHGLVFGCKYKV